MSSTQSDTDVLESLGGVESSIKVPLLAPMISDSIIQLHLDVVV